MIVGTTMIHDGTGTTAYRSPPFWRGGQAALFSLEVTHIGGSPTLVVKVEHMNEDDPTWDVAATFTNITATGVHTKNVTGLKSIVRVSFTFSTGSAGNFVHVVAAAPAWRDY